MSLPSKTSRPRHYPLATFPCGDSPAYQKKGALCDLPRTLSSRLGWHLLEFEDVALGIPDVDRKTLTMRPVTHRRLAHHHHRLSAKVARDLVQVASLDSDA